MKALTLFLVFSLFTYQHLFSQDWDQTKLEKYFDLLEAEDRAMGSVVLMQNGEVVYIRNFGYANREQKQEPFTDMSIPLGAGAIVSTPEDLSHFIRSLMQGKIISEESLSSMTEIKNNYGRGIFKIPFYEDFAFGHDGGIDGFRSNLSYFPERDLAYCLTLNGVSFDPNQISIAVLSAFFGKEFELPVFKDISLTEEELDKMAGTYAASGFPLEITIRREHMSLMAQATGQPEFLLEYEEGNRFVFKMANLSLEFFPETEEMSFEQGALKFMMKKKN